MYGLSKLLGPITWVLEVLSVMNQASVASDPTTLDIQSHGITRVHVTYDKLYFTQIYLGRMLDKQVFVLEDILIKLNKNTGTVEYLRSHRSYWVVAKCLVDVLRNQKSYVHVGQEISIAIQHNSAASFLATFSIFNSCQPFIFSLLININLV